MCIWNTVLTLCVKLLIFTDQVLWFGWLQYGKGQDWSSTKVAEGTRRPQAADAGGRCRSANRQHDPDSGDGTTAQGLSAAEQVSECVVNLVPTATREISNVNIWRLCSMACVHDRLHLLLSREHDVWDERWHIKHYSRPTILLICSLIAKCCYCVAVEVFW